MPPLDVTVTDKLFFKYFIEDVSDLDNILLLLNLSNKKDLQVYINLVEYPSIERNQHVFVIGDIPKPILMAKL